MERGLFFLGALLLIILVGCQCEDIDGDGYTARSPNCASGSDCDDTDSDISPGGVESPIVLGSCSDGKDNNCVDGTDCEDPACSDDPSCRISCDNDGDGFDSTYECGGNDCHDYNPDINPEKREICGDFLDNNCNGYIDENCENCAGGIVRCNGETPERCEVKNGLPNYYALVDSCPPEKKCFSYETQVPNSNLKVGKAGCVDFKRIYGNHIGNEFGFIKMLSSPPEIKRDCIDIFDGYIKIDKVLCPSIEGPFEYWFGQEPLPSPALIIGDTNPILCDTFESDSVCLVIDYTLQEGGLLGINYPYANSITIIPTREGLVTEVLDEVGIQAVCTVQKDTDGDGKKETINVPNHPFCYDGHVRIPFGKDSRGCPTDFDTIRCGEGCVEVGGSAQCQCGDPYNPGYKSCNSKCVKDEEKYMGNCKCDPKCTCKKKIEHDSACIWACSQERCYT
ncbi:putative metal-binding motif-containing protein [Nanoarchaeota archaeon]